MLGEINYVHIPCLSVGLGLTQDELPQYTDWSVMEPRITEIFLTKTRDEWTRVFENLDACFAPVLEMREAEQHPHNVLQGNFLSSPGGDTEPAPAPNLSRTPGIRQLPPRPDVGQHTETVLGAAGFTHEEIRDLEQSGAVFQCDKSSKAKL